MRPFVLVFLPLVVAYAMTLVWIWDSWWLPDSYYSHGPLIPPGIALVLWLTRDRWIDTPAGADGRGWLLLGPGLLMHLAGAALMVDSMSAASLVLTVPGAVWVALGMKRLQRVVWPVLLVAFAIPLPMFVTGRLAFELKEIAVGGALGLVNAFGLGAERVGAQIAIPGQEVPLQVADPCSGLNSLVALTTMGYCVAFFVGPQRGARRWVLLLAAAPIAVLSNVLRIAGICALASWSGVEFATRTGHDILGYAAWIVDLALLLLLDRVMTSLQERRG